uniref:Uncharacterized protein n=1 Tax=Anguilla anguilla TaxID=7936 RepID=A0A0E9PCN6_ANGAN
MYFLEYDNYLRVGIITIQVFFVIKTNFTKRATNIHVYISARK